MNDILMKPFRTIIGGVQLLLLILIIPLVGHSQSTESRATQLRSLVKSDVFSMGAVVRAESHFWLDNENEPGGRRFDLGATRLDFRGRLDDNFSYRLHLDLRQNPSLMNAEFGYRYAQNHRVVVGAFKPYTSTDLDPSPNETDFHGRARLVGTMMNNRELGITLLGDFGNLQYRVGMYNGTRLTRQNDDRFMYTLRLSYSAELGENTLTVGINSFLNQTRNVNVGNTGLTSTGDRVLYGGYFRYQAERFFVTAEASQTRFDAAQLAGAEETINGFFGTVGYHVSELNEVLIRLDRIQFDVRDTESNLLLVGLNHRPNPLVKIQLNALTRLDGTAYENFGVISVFQVAF
jgi:hypothetical protein